MPGALFVGDPRAVVVEDAADAAVLEAGGAEVQEEAEGEVEEAEVGEGLAEMDRGQDFDRLELDPQAAILKLPRQRLLVTDSSRPGPSARCTASAASIT